MRTWLRSMFAVLAIGLPVLAFGGEAEAKGKGKAPLAAVTVDAKFNRFLVHPDGKIGAILLDNGVLVMVHPDAVRDTSLKAGDAIKVEAKVKTKGAGPLVYVRAKITKGTVVVVDDTAHQGKGKGKGKGKGNQGAMVDLSVSSKVSSMFVGPKGKVRGIILDDGTAAWAPHHQDLGTFSLKKGDAITVTGKGGNYALGRSLVIKTIKLPSGDVKTL
ncbi:MAG: hypothetical protein HYV09_23625 [Deltaproteobacteria bacterium]|nr:hypothetical protein [Deltaproteobacteria bacterium]